MYRDGDMVGADGHGDLADNSASDGVAGLVAGLRVVDVDGEALGSKSVSQRHVDGCCNAEDTSLRNE